MMSDDDRPKRALEDDRDYADWFKAIGPEDEDPEVIAENLEDSFSLFSEDDFESSPTTPSDQPGWVEEAVWGEDMTFFPENDQDLDTLFNENDDYDVIDEDEL